MSLSGDVTSREEMSNVFDRLIDDLRNDRASEIPTSLLQIKSMHRLLFNQIQLAERDYTRMVAQHQKRLRNREAAQYEKRQLGLRINMLKTFSTPNLLQLAREEVGPPDQTDDELKSDVELIQQFFGARDIANPADRDQILHRLHQEINARGKLEQTVKIKKEQLGKLLKEVKQVTQTLTSFPQHVAAIERASFPLQKMFPDSLVGSDRRVRFEQAQSLPAPLYVLTQQLQQFVDDLDEKNKPNVSIDKNQVAFFLPVLDPAHAYSQSSINRPTKKVTITFSYDEDSHQVLAAATGCPLLFQDVLLQELFPGDTATGTSPNQRALPYQWCNYLAGLHRLPQQQRQHIGQPSFASTRVIVAELQRRVSANATLKYLISCFQRGKVPPLPSSLAITLEAGVDSLEVTNDVVFTQIENDISLVAEYTAMLMRGSTNLRAHVRVHLARYPAVPPVWSLSNQDTSGLGDRGEIGTVPVYDDALADLERRVNVELLEQICGKESSTSQLYEWILAAQWREILCKWVQWDDDKAGGRKRKATD